ncbi:ABC transporter ATP-binding protein [Micromonospora sp. DT47]|uniref:ABC transporter ATP-binding protein n=1 Tax=Micromonospora sp. DT47 TaxID=3393431 RepID=UPI003CFBA14B
MSPAPSGTLGDGIALALDHVGVRFGGLVALDDVSLRVPPGHIVGVIGPNGAGKTTLFNVVCGFVPPTTGSLTLDGQPFRPRPHRLTRVGIARTLQGVGLFPGLTVCENVMAGASHAARAGFAAALFGLPRSDRDERLLRERALDLLAELGVARHADAATATLPYAVRKRVALARALIARPRLLLLDEPAGGLSADDIAELGELITALPRRADRACSIMLVEHHMDLVMSVCHELVVLDFGRVVAAGTPEQVRDDPLVTEAYLGADVLTEAPGPGAGS